MRPTFIYTALLLLFVVSTNAEIKDDSYVEPHIDECKSALKIRIRGKGQSESQAATRIGCLFSCFEGTTEFKNNRCPELCDLPKFDDSSAKSAPKTPAKRCELCSDGADGEIVRCKNTVNSAILLCMQGCLTNQLLGNKPNYQVSSTSGGITLEFESEVTTLP